MSSIIENKCAKCRKPIIYDVSFKGKIDRIVLLERNCLCEGTDWEIAFGETQDETYTRMDILKKDGKWILGQPTIKTDKSVMIEEEEIQDYLLR